MKMENLKQVSIKTGLQAIVFRNKLLHVFILFEYLIAKFQTCFGKQVIQLEQQLEDYLKILPAIYCCSAWSSYSLGAPQGGSKIPTQIKKNGFFKMQPKIVVVLVLSDDHRTP